MKTVWKRIPNFSLYEVSNFGEIRKRNYQDIYGNCALGYVLPQKWGKVTIENDNNIKVLVDIKKLYKELFQNAKNKK